MLFVSRDTALVRAIWSMGESSSWQLEMVATAWEAMERVQSGAGPHLLLLDLPRGDVDGLHILRWLRRFRSGLPVILIGHPGDFRQPQDVMRLGARDCLVRPLDEAQLAAAIRNHLSMVWEPLERMATEGVELIDRDSLFVGVSPVMRKLRSLAALLAQANHPVLILGEGGSGKETTARLVHELSLRSRFEFTEINCAALPGDLLERELFGYERNGTGAAAERKAGKLELGRKGTILLDEITEMPMSVQANLMRVLEHKQFIRPGTCVSVEVDVRVIASSTRNLEHAVSDKRFHEDLYHVLSAHTIHVPPLRDRKADIRPLSLHFMHRLARRYGVSPRDLSAATLEACQAYSWPGNLRELELFVKRHLLTGDEDQVLEENQADWDGISGNWAWSPPRAFHSRQPSPSPSHGPVGSPDSLRSLAQNAKFEAERNAIIEALQKTGGNRKAAASLLKVSYRTLLYKIEQYQLRAATTTMVPGRNGPKSAGRPD